MNTKTIVTDEVTRIMNYLLEGNERYQSSNFDKWYAGKLEQNANAVSINLRFDFELPADKVDNPIIHTVGTGVLSADLLDLIVNGDITQSGDPVIKGFDGEVKRGQKVKSVEILSASMLKEYKDNKNFPRYEYTVYVRPYVVFEDGSEVTQETKEEVKV